MLSPHPSSGKSNPHHKYYIQHGDEKTELSSSTSERDLGVLVDPDLSFDSHYIHVVKKARTMSGLLIRAITFKSKTIMLPLYKAFLRSILEYANPVWFPYKRKDIDMIEDVKRHFRRTVIGLRDLDYHQRFESLKLPSLEYRRVGGDMIELYKICQRIYDPATTHTLVNFSLRLAPPDLILINSLRLG